MSDDLSTDDVEAVREIIQGATLKSVEFFEISARRHDELPPDHGEGRLNIEVQQRVDATSFGVRLNAHIVLPIGEASASVAGEYELADGLEPSDRALRMFTNEVGVMVVSPYLREAVATITSKVFGSPVYLPVVQRGEIALDVPDAGNATK